MDEMKLNVVVVDSTREDVTNKVTRPVCGNLVAVLRWTATLADEQGQRMDVHKYISDTDTLPMSLDEAWEQAKENTRKMYSFEEPRSMVDVIQMGGMDVPEIPGAEMPPMPQVFICWGNAGAQLMFPDRLEEMRKAVGCDELYIAPTSRHELMAGVQETMVSIFEMLGFMNDNVVDPHEVLSDQCFKYADGQLTTCLLTRAMIG